MGCDAVSLGELFPKFRGIVVHLQNQLVSLLGLLDPEYDGITILRNVENHSPSDTTSNLARLEFSGTRLLDRRPLKVRKDPAGSGDGPFFNVGLQSRNYRRNSEDNLRNKFEPITFDIQVDSVLAMQIHYTAFFLELWYNY